METDPMIDGVQMMGILLEEDMTSLSIRVVTQQIEEDNRLETLPVLFVETEVVIFGVVIDVLLERPRAKWTILAECGERDNVKAEILAYQVGSHFPLIGATLDSGSQLFGYHVWSSLSE
jgi:hypothetical protein